MKTTLYAIDNKNQIRVWSVEEISNGIIMLHGVIDGAMQEKQENIFEGLATRTVEEQIHSRAESRIKKKIDAGYCRTLEEAQNKPRTNSLGFKKPMLAAKFVNCKKIDYDNLYYQFKYNGNRMPTANKDGFNIPYTRGGMAIETIPEIVEQMCIPENCTVDGEIYHHGTSLQTINSWVKRRQENTQLLKYHVYDIMLDKPYSERLEILKNIDFGDRAELVPTHKFDPLGDKTIKDLLDEARKLGYEGLILRQDGFGYEDGKRSKSLIKVKHFDDDEFLITGTHLSKDGLPMLDLITEEGLKFKVTMPGSMSQKHKTFQRKDLVDMWCHAEYAEITDAGKPFHVTALHILKTKDELK